MKSSLLIFAMIAFLTAGYSACAQEICFCPKGKACDTQKCPMGALNPQPKPKP